MSLQIIETIVMGPFMSQKTVSISFFTGCCARNIIFYGES